MLRTLTAAALCLISTSTAVASMMTRPEPDIMRFVIAKLNVSESKEASWGDDILGMDVLPDGQDASINFPDDADECSWDIQIWQYQDDGSEKAWYVNGVNLCGVYKVTFSTESGAVVYKTE